MATTRPSIEPAPALWFICTAFVRTSEVWLHRQAHGLKSFDTRVVTRERVNESTYPASALTVDVLPPRSELPRCSPPERIRAALEKLLRLPNRFRGRSGEKAWWTERLQSDRPRVALCQFGDAAVHLWPLLRSFGVPTVAHFHGYDISSALGDRKYRSRLQRTLPHFAGNVVVAEYQRQRLLELGAEASRIRVIPCGVPVAEFEPSGHVEDQPCRFLSVGRFVDKKRHDLTIRAFAECRRDHPDASLTIIGDGPNFAACRHLAASLGIAGRVHFPGAQPIHEVRRELNRASAFVLHCVTSPGGDKEGWPVAIAEAAACGLAIISTTHASIPTQIEHNHAGLLSPEHDWPQMADHMKRLAREPRLRAKMGEAARNQIAQFDAQHQIAQLDGFLREIAAAASPSHTMPLRKAA